MAVETLKRKASFNDGGHAGKRQQIEQNHGSRKLPTAAEVDEIAASSSLYRSSQFHELMKSLLDDVSPPESLLTPVETVLHELHTFLTTLPSHTPSQPLEAAAKLEKKRGIKIVWPSPAPSASTQHKVGFEPPTPAGIYIVGSFAGTKKTLVRSRSGKFCIDMTVEIPENLLQEKDYLNSRAFHIRAFYLAYIASQLSSKKSPLKSKVETHFDAPGGDPRRTCLLLTPLKGTFDPSFSIRIIPSLPQTSPIPLHRVSPTHCSIRPPDATHAPTPHYSSALALFTLPKTLLLLNHTLSSQLPSFTDAIRLLKVWATQRCYATSESRPEEPLSTSGWGVLGFESGRSLLWSCLIAALVFGEETGDQKGEGKGKGRLNPILQIGKGLSSYQLFRAVMDLLATRNFAANHLLVRAATESQSTPFPREHWTDSDEPVLVEPSGRHNVLDGVSNGVLQLMAIDAKRTLSMLNRRVDTHSDAEVEIFQEVFTRDAREPSGRFDAYFELDLTKARSSADVIELQDAGSERTYLLERIHQILNRGLSDRIHAITILTPRTNPHPTSSFPSPLSSTVGLGLIFNSPEAYRLVDRGPISTASDEQSPSEELKVFLQLWGSKAELRRFKDGIIQQSVVWDLPTGMQAHTARERIPGRIIRHLLDLHFGMKSEDVREVFVRLDDVLCFDKAAERDLGIAVNLSWTAAQKSFDDLVKLLKAVSSTSDVPLSLTSVQATSPYLRYTSVFPAYPATSSESFQSWSSGTPSHSRYLPSLPIVLHFEKSTSWPDDVVAMQSVKLALLEALARSLLVKEGWKGAVRVVTGTAAGNTELDGWAGADKARLEVITPEGFAFEGRIYHNREAVLLKRIIEPPKITGPLAPPPTTANERHIASLALHRHVQHYIHEPTHHAAVLALHHRHPALSHTIRLAKRFLNSQLLGGSIHDSAVELLVCASFFKDASSSTGGSRSDNHLPASGNRGFVSFLRFLAEWDWKRGVDIPLYAIAKSEMPNDELSGDFPQTEAEGVESGDMIAQGATYHLRTAHDPKGVVFTSPASSTPGPSPVIVRRITDVARSAYMHIVQNVGAPDHRLLFTPSTKHYDFIIHIEPSALRRERENIQRSLHSAGEYYRNLHLGPTMPEEPLRVGFDPAYMYFLDIQRTYSDIALLLTDPQCPTIIGGVWNPTLKEARRWRVMTGYSAKPVEPSDPRDKKTKEMVVLNEQAILKEIERMGKGIVSRIEVTNQAEDSEADDTTNDSEPDEGSDSGADSE